MRSHQLKDKSNQNRNKKTKVMQYVNLISNKINLKSEKINFNIQINKNSSINKKSYNSKQKFDVHKKQNKEYKDKLYLSSNEYQRHHRSKTQNLKSVEDKFKQNIFEEDEIMIPCQDYKRNINKVPSAVAVAAEHKRKLKTQSCKKINTNSSSKESTIKYKSNLITEMRDQNNLSRGKNYPNRFNSKNTDIQQKQNPEKTQKYISNLNENLGILKSKFAKQKSTNNNKSKQKTINKNQKSKNDSKNMTLSNLSQILHRNNSQRLEQSKLNRNHLNISIQKNKKLSQQTQNKLIRTYNSLSKKIVYITENINDEVKERYKKNIGIRDKHDNEYIQKQFSFINYLSKQQKYGQSNFSTGVQNLGLDNQIKQLLKLKLKTQIKVNDEIYKDLKLIKQLNEQNEYKVQTQRKTVLDRFDQQQQQGSQSRTFRQKILDKEIQYTRSKDNQDNKFQINTLIDYLIKYQEMTGCIIPIVSEISEISQINNEKQKWQENIYKDSKTQLRNKKLIQKHNQIIQKNLKYQKIFNLLIQDGVDVQKYVKKCFTPRK